ncbi:hypothetical protein [Streptomyces odontomachi]|uniref:hypothetical protein n=1 Tax=Streptomyces odontomachi TaxID=2944940 RepID=UPI00210E8F25|nr:hypothetical protein [Streptomyces sp. ODS25]
MEAELATLAAAGATALVQRMVGDGWERARGLLARVVARRRGSAEGETDGADEAVREAEGELDAAREQLLAARDSGDEETVADVQAEWRSRLRRTLEADPTLAAELRSVLDELTPSAPQDGGNITYTYNTMTGGSHGTVIQAGSIGATHHHHTGPPPQQPPR